MAVIVKTREFVPQSFLKTIDNLFNKLNNSTEVENAENETRWFHPRVNVIEKKDSYVIQLALPGWTKNEIDVKVDDSVLSVSGTKRPGNDKDHFYHSYEFDYGRFEKKFQLPEGEEIKVNAEMKNGILEIIAEKPTVKDTKKTIEIK